jgi:hypothetical protein
MVDADDLALIEPWRWWVNCNGYAIRQGRRDGQRWSIFMHRVILGLELGDSRSVDHINRDKLDNRRLNLRTATQAENRQNVGSLGGSSRFRGVAWLRRERKWQAKAQLNGRTFWLGNFRDELAAAHAAEAFRASRMPFAEPDIELLGASSC